MNDQDLADRDAGAVGAPPRLMPVAWRKRLGTGAVVATWVIAALGADYAGQTGPGRLDRPIDNHLIALNSRIPDFFAAIVLLGDPFVVALMMIIGVAGLLRRRQPRAAALVAAAPLVAGVVTDWILKPLIDRTFASGPYTYPSGHTTGAFTVAFVVVVLLWRQNRWQQNRWQQGRWQQGRWQQSRLSQPRSPARAVLLSLLALGLASCTGAAVVALGWHYATDALGGLCVAYVVVVVVSMVIDWAADRAATRAAHPSP